LKILGVSCSPRPAGNTQILLEEALDGARTEGAEIELISLKGKEIKPCDACGACHKTGKCHITDDMAEVYGKMAEADGIIFGTPVYFYGMPAQLKTLIDRTFAPPGEGKSLSNKVGGAIVTAGSVGIIDVLKDLYFYFAVKKMIAGNWVGAYPNGTDAIENMTGTLKASRELGQEMVKIAETGFKYPRGFARSHFAYGTHTH